MSSGDQPGSRKEAWDNWEANFTSRKPHDSCHGGAPSWSKRNNANKRWDKGQSVNRTRSMSKPNVKNQVNSWDKNKAEFFQYGSLERPKTFEGGRGLGSRAGRGGSRGGRDQFGRGRGSGGDQFGRGRGGGRGGGDQFGRERGRAGRGGRDQSGRGRGVGRGDGDQFGMGRGGGRGAGDQLGRGRGGEDQFGRGRDCGRGGKDQFGRGRDCGRGGEGQFGRGRSGGRGGGQAQFGRGRSGGRGGGDQFGRRRGSGRGQTSGFGRGGQQNYVKSDGSKDAQASGCKYTAGVTQDQAGKWGGPRKDGENAAGRGDHGGRGFCGSGGRMGRGGRGGGRDQFGRGRSFDRGQSPGWTYGGTPLRNPSSWSGDQTAGGWGSRNTFNAAKKDDGQAGGRKRAAEIMGGQSESWDNQKRDGKSATTWAWQ